jgi:signal transduction histidine kinase
MDSMIQLFIIAQILGTSTVYLAAMFVLKRSNTLGTVFFGSGMIFVVSLITLLFRNEIGEELTRAINSSLKLVYLSIIFTILTLTVDGSKKQKLMSLIIMLILIILCYIISAMMLNELGSLIVLSIITCCLLIVASQKAYMGYKILSSRGMLLISIASALSIIGQILRLDELIFGSGTFLFSQFTWKTNFLMASGLISILAVNIGYLGFLIENSEKDALISEKEKEELREEKERIEILLKEHDRMIIKASRLSSLNKISIYTAAVIHEITQPVQALKLAIGSLKILIDDKDYSSIKKNIEQINAINKRIQDIVLVLRGVITKGRANIEVISPHEVIERALPIISGECLRRGIVFDSQIQNSEVLIEANAALLQRIIFNLYTNAIESLSMKESEDKLIIMRSYLNSESSSYCIEVLDSGGGDLDPGDISLNLESISDTAKEDGMGLGLAFSNGIIKSWNGNLYVERIEENGDSLTKFCISLPQKSVASSIYEFR